MINGEKLHNRIVIGNMMHIESRSTKATTSSRMRPLCHWGEKLYLHDAINPLPRSTTPSLHEAHDAVRAHGNKALLQLLLKTHQDIEAPLTQKSAIETIISNQKYYVVPHAPIDIRPLDPEFFAQ